MPWLLGGYMWLYLHRPFEYWTFLGTMQIERVYMIALMLYWMVYPHKEFVRNRLQPAVILFVLIVCVCWVASPYPQEAGQKVIEDHLKVGVFFILLITSIRDEKGLKQMLTLYLCSLALYQGHSLLEFANGRYEYRMHTVRMKAVDLTYGDPNTFAATLLHAIPFILPFWLVPESTRTRKLIVGYVVMSLLCILLTGSRRALIGVLVMTLFLIWRSRHRWSLLILFGLMAPVGFSILRPDLQERFMTLVDSNAGPSNAHTSSKFRWLALLDALDLIQKNPVTGVGPASFGVAVGHGFQAHNLYAQTMGELGLLGILGLGGMVWAFYANYREILRLYEQHPWWPKDFPYQVGRTAWLAVALLLFMGMGGHNLYRYNWMWFGAFQIIALHCARTRAARELDLAYLDEGYAAETYEAPYPYAV